MIPILTEAQRRVHEALDDYFTSGAGGALDLAPWGPDLRTRLSDYTRRGKLLRGAMVSLGYSLFAGDLPAPRSCVDAGVVMELLQSFLLIHDDIMDRDLVRRGRPSIHAQYVERCPVDDDQTAERYGGSMGLCAGDIAAFLAVMIMSTLEVEPATRVEILSIVSREIIAVGLAQMQDVHNGYLADVEEEAILQVYTYKTGRYTFSLPLSIGAMIAGADQKQIEVLGRIGEALGRIFQLRDDQLGIFGSTEKIGKPAGSDIREDKKTLIRHYVFERTDANGPYRALFGKESITEKELEDLRDYLRTSGILDAIETVVEKQSQLVRELIDTLELAPGGREALNALLAYNLTRNL